MHLSARAFTSSLGCTRQRFRQACLVDDYAHLIGLLATVLLLGAWREQRSDNRRDAWLLAVIGAGGMLAGAAAWLS